jgi:hypothetical protein
MQPDIPSGFTTMLAAMVALGWESTTGQMMRTCMNTKGTLDASRQKAGPRVANSAKAVATSLHAEELSKTFRLLVHGLLPLNADGVLHGVVAARHAASTAAAAQWPAREKREADG